MSPKALICWYREKDIEQIAAYESEKGLRVFPRYIVYDPLYTEIHNFCWTHRLISEFVDIKELPFPITEIMSSNPKKTLSKNFDFMHILDIVHLQDTCAHISLKSQIIINYGRQCKLFKSCENKDILTAEEHEYLSKIIWSNFTKKYVQDLVEGLAEKFIDDYIELSRRLNFTYAKAWALKEKYLVNLAESIDSRPKREKLKKGTKDQERKSALEAEQQFPGVKIISDNSQINRIKIEIAKLNKVNAQKLKILLLGETGTGKELFARAIHEASGLPGNFQKVDCGSLSESLFESELFGHVKGAFSGAHKDKQSPFEVAAGGTVFLDEIGNLSSSTQPKLLRVLEERKYAPVGAPSDTKSVDALIVLATSKDLEKEAKEGTFMKDLFYRIYRHQINIPPLRERKEDISLLFEFFIEKHLKDLSRPVDGQEIDQILVTEDCIKTLQDFEWLGNVRELEGVAENIILKRLGSGDRSPINASDLPEHITGKPTSQPSLNIPKKPPEKYGRLPKDDSELIALESEGNSRQDIGKMYGVSREAVSRRFSKINKKNV